MRRPTSRGVRWATCWTRLAHAVVSIFFFGGCSAAPPVLLNAVPLHAVDVQLEAQKRSWQASYLISEPTGRASEVPTGREIHIPLGAGVRLRLASRDYISDFAIAGLELRDFAAPNLPSDLYFVADRAGRYEVRGDELCGLPHTDRARGWLVVEDAPTYLAWIRERIGKKHG